MANIKFSKSQFEREVGKLNKEMEEKIALFGTPLEFVTDEEIELEIFPNRPDLLSYQGFKRSFLNFIGKSKGIKNYKINKPEKDYEVKVDSSLKDIRPFTACAIVKNLKLDDEKIKEMVDLQEKLHGTLGRNRKKVAIGIYPLEKIEMPIVFKALEPDKIKFQPLESEREMTGLQILQRHPAGREYAHLLAGKSKFPVFVDAKQNVLSMPPIINSHLTGKITEKTKEVFIECSGFDFNTLQKCLNIIITTLADLGGKIYQINLKLPGQSIGNQVTPNLDTEKNKISLEATNKLLGLDLNEKQLKQLLEKAGHEYDTKTKTVESPAWRTDLLHEVDLIEDVAISYGYQNFVPEIPEISAIGTEDQKETVKRKISDILAGLGMLETLNYFLTTRSDQLEKNFSISEQEVKKDSLIEIQSSKTDYSFLRNDLTHYALKNLSENSDSEYPQKIFETGRVFEIDNQTKKIDESESLAVAMAPGNYTDIKQTLEYLFKMLGLEETLKIEDVQDSSPVPGYFVKERVAGILFKKKLIGYIGEIHPKILRKWKIKMPVALFELSLEDIFENLGT